MTNELIRWQVAEVDIDTAEPIADITWRENLSAGETNMLMLWIRLRDQWLNHMDPADAPRPHTRRSYTTATNLWFDWISNHGLMPWEVTSTHVRAWKDWLVATGKSNSTVGQRMSAVSSYYSFIINERHIVNGIEISAFIDANGHTRANPFKIGNVKRPEVTPYHKAHPMSADVFAALFDHLRAHAHTVTGARNYALLLSHALTAARGSEICRLRWGDIRPNRNRPNQYVFAWTGKGGKAQTDPFPADAYHAIVAYLKHDGRWATIDDDDYIFPMLRTHQLRNLRSYRPGMEKEARHISGKTVQSILRSALKRAGVADWDQYRVHDMRHGYAIAHYAAFKDIEALRGKLHHNSISTTEIYMRELTDPVDTDSQRMAEQLKIF